MTSAALKHKKNPLVTQRSQTQGVKLIVPIATLNTIYASLFSWRNLSRNILQIAT